MESNSLEVIKRKYTHKKCIHDKRKSECVQCKGSQICEHNKRRYICVMCKGNGICDHGKRKERCVQCKGSQICEHSKIKYKCVQCKGNGVCEHGKQKIICVACKGNGICEHNKRRYNCVLCKGNGICNHGKQKIQCKDCSLQSWLIKLQHTSIARCLKKCNLEKTKPTIEYLGCNALYFKNYIQSKMTDEMTLDNIHIDHIKPINAFNLNDHDEFLKCCHYSNFQPLLARDNRQKRNKWNEENEKFWIENICEKEYKPIYIP